MNVNYYNPYANSELVLMHHGIAGQRWGKRNGPPYPLVASSKSASEKKAAVKKSSSGSSKHKSMSSSTKKKIAVGAGIAASVLGAGVGAYYLNKSGALNKTIAAGRRAASKVGAIKDKLPKTKNQRIKRAVKSMSDSELNSKIDRLKKENELAKLMGSSKEVNTSSKGKKLMESLYDSVASKIIVPIGVGVVSYQVKTYADKKLDPKIRQEVMKNVNAKKK